MLRALLLCERTLLHRPFFVVAFFNVFFFACLQTDYPYTSGTAGVTGTCKADSSDFVVGITGYHTVSSSAAGESTMAAYVGSTGPLSICVDAEQWSSYSGGVMTVCGNSVDHCVQAVGIDTAAALPYWIVRNSWGVTWGEAG